MSVWAKRLKDSDAKKRRAALREIEILGDPATLPLLAELYATDTDDNLRKLAQKIGQEIYYNQHHQRETAPETTSSDEERQRAAEILAQAERKRRERLQGDKR